MAGLAGTGAPCVGLVVLVAFGRGVARVGEALHLAPLQPSAARQGALQGGFKSMIKNYFCSMTQDKNGKET